jgi:imidazole glycerol-phosphate synthase subunit HisH
VIGIVDYGCGNLRSLENALAALGHSSRRLTEAADVLDAQRLILPGVGNYGHAGAELERRGLASAVRERALAGGPVLGICLGMQLLFEGSEEAPETPGLGLLEGRFLQFKGEGLKVPHMGWNTVDFGGRTVAAYFVHSYYLPAFPAGRAAQVLGTSSYGVPFLAAFRSGNVAGFQFHPEKSGAPGLALLDKALRWS